MKYSHNWLQRHIAGDAPSPKDIEAMLTMKAFEVEEVIDVDGDSVLNIKVLPDRSHDALSHFGMAKEIVSLYYSAERSLVKQDYFAPVKKDSTLPAPTVIVDDARACPRFMAMTIRNIKIGPSHGETKKLLEAIGQKSISNVVDATNYVLYDLGKPMHVFDADKVVGAITVRFAKTGEELTTLDGKNIHLDETILVIADDMGPLSIAGIKGGSRAEVDDNTTSIIIESANFNGALLRKTSTKVGIKTDAVRRYENGITSELCEPGLYATANLILESAGTGATEISQITDVYAKPEVQYKVGVSTREINKVLGTTLTDERVAGSLTQRGFGFEKKDVVSEVTNLAKESIGKPYKRGASVLYDAPNAFDCSSLTAYLYKEAGVAIPRMAVDQYVFSHLREGEAQPGDLLFVNTGIQKTNTGSYYSQVLGKDIQESAVRFESVEWMPGTKVVEGVDHVGVYMGDGQVLHATSSAGCVVLEKIEESELFKNGYTCKFVIPETENRFVITVPFERLDIRIKEDLIDEVGKLVGTADSKPTTTYEQAAQGSYDTSVYYSNVIRRHLVSEGFSEVMTSSFSSEGDIDILNSVDPKKNKLRNTLSMGMVDTLNKGLYYLPFLGKEELIKTFEIGSVFSSGVEKLNVVIAVATKNKKIKKGTDKIIQETLDTIWKEMGISEEKPINNLSNNDGMFAGVEFTLDVKNLSSVKAGVAPSNNQRHNIKYQSLSNYPFIARDVAFFVENDIDTVALERELKDIAGELCVKHYQFDRFQKEGETRVSYGYRFVFQSFEKTLTDEEVEVPMQKIYTALQEKGFETR